MCIHASWKPRELWPSLADEGNLDLPGMISDLRGELDQLSNAILVFERLAELSGSKRRTSPAVPTSKATKANAIRTTRVELMSASKPGKKEV